METRRLAERLARILTPAADALAVETAICEQVLMDAMNECPQPPTVAQILSVLERSAAGWRTVPELIAALRRRSRESPDLLLDELVG